MTNKKTNKLKNKRGFSLVELMVVVAIMGTLASIAIPAFNEYRKSAKKASYRADLTSLHKGWLAFGVELDSFCRRESDPRDVSIANVGMETLRTSKLYGNREARGLCSDSSYTDSGDCTSNGGMWDSNAIPSGNGPGKHNFIGFGQEDCTNPGTLADATANVHVIEGAIGTDATQIDSACVLREDSYRMGVYGHISGLDYFGISIANNGVLSAEEIGQTGASGDANCS